MHTKSELLELLRAHRIRLQKRLGQHYLIDPRLTTQLVNTCELSAHDRVVEIGAGLGALTDLLAARANQVLAVEVDHAICELLKVRMKELPNVQVLCQDILGFSWERVSGSKVVGTIPYHITSPILVSLCEQSTTIAEVWLGLQREVASRLQAKPGTKAYGRLTILVQYRFEVEAIMRIPRSAFFPQPQVDSVWVRLAPRPSPAVVVRDERLFFEVVKVAFSQRRKTLLNCLVTLTRPRLDRDGAASVIRQAGLLPRVRGEELSLESFARLADAVSQLR